ncbi:MAG: MFS transporter [Desulfosporosinus sp.]|nr:MFS transporter [Desulfosporosinus sp.]
MFSKINMIIKNWLASGEVPPEKVESVYKLFRIRAIAGMFLAYMGYYITRNSFTLSTPYLKEYLHLSVSEIGFLSSCLLLSYGLFAAVMGALADKFNVKYFIAFGLAMSCVMNILMGFSSAVWMFVGLLVLNGVFQGMGRAPAYITMANWYPKVERGRVAAVWNISHNIGGGVVAPIVALGIFLVGTSAWPIASYIFPAIAGGVLVCLTLLIGKDVPAKEGLPTLDKMYSTELSAETQFKENAKPPNEMNPWQIFIHYIVPNGNIWILAMLDIFVYIVRFGTFSWLPLYLLHVKGFSKAEMSVAFLVFEWAAIPSTLLTGYVSDKLFKGYRMPPAIIAAIVMAAGLYTYWISTSIVTITIAAAVVGCMIYIPQFAVNVQSMEVVPTFAVGAGTALRGISAYLFGAMGGTAVIGFVVDRYGWDAGFGVLLFGVAGILIFSILAHFGVKKLYKKHDLLLCKQQAQAEELR